MISGSNVLYAVYRVDDSEHGVQEFRIISLTDESGIIDTDRLQNLDLPSLRKSFPFYIELDQAMQKLARILGCDRFVCLSLPEYNRLVADSTDLEMLHKGMKSYAKMLGTLNKDGPETAQTITPAPQVMDSEKDSHKKGWMGRIFS
jgi:hypothetical protein